MRGLRGEAARRDVPITRLVHDLQNVIVTDRLTTAILDDWPPRTCRFAVPAAPQRSPWMRPRRRPYP